MGITLNQVTIAAFVDELTKEANPSRLSHFVSLMKNKVLRNPKDLFSLRTFGQIGKGAKGVIGDVEEAGRRALHPIQGMRSGWEHMAPTNKILRKAEEQGIDPSQLQSLGQELPADSPLLRSLTNGGGKHLLNPGQDLSSVSKSPSALAEELSRRGWTGQGNKTKYLPVGDKSMAVGFAGMAIPSIVNSEQPTPTGEGAGVERGLGELGTAAGTVLAGGLGVLPGLGLWYGAHQAGSRLGRVVDRLRAGAGVRQAIEAPSPQEASNQLDTIKKYYGGN